MYALRMSDVNKEATYLLTIYRLVTGIGYLNYRSWKCSGRSDGSRWEVMTLFVMINNDVIVVRVQWAVDCDDLHRHFSFRHHNNQCRFVQLLQCT